MARLLHNEKLVTEMLRLNPNLLTRRAQDGGRPSEEDLNVLELCQYMLECLYAPIVLEYEYDTNNNNLRSIPGGMAT